LRTILAILVLFALGYAGANWYLWHAQRELIFFPSRDVHLVPSSQGLPYEEVWIPVGSNPSARLNGWWLPAHDATAPTLLYLHGNDFNLSSNLEHIARFHRMGFAVFAIDYRGYGKSEGAFPSEAQVYDDAEAAWDYLVLQRRIEPRRIFIFGHSLGGAIAIELALRRPDAAGVIAEGTFTSVPELASRIYWMFPTGWLVNQHFDSLGRVPKLRVPILFIHGKADTEIPYAMSEALYRASAEPKWLTLVPGGGHEDSARVDGSPFEKAVTEFAATVDRH